MKSGNVIRGLAILCKEDSYCIAAEHDQIFAGNDPESYSVEEKAELEALGWFVDQDSYSAFV